MLTRFAKMLSSFFISKKFIKEDDRDVYDYCFEIMLSTLINFTVILVIALITKTIILTALYIVSFMIVRGTAGGYHAQSHLSCLGILVFSYSSFLALLHLLPNIWLKIMSLCFIIIAVVLVFILSPVEDHNKPLNDDETKKFKKKSRIVILLLSFSTLGLIALISNTKYAFSFAAGMFTVSVSLVAGKIKNNILVYERE